MRNALLVLGLVFFAGCNAEQVPSGQESDKTKRDVRQTIPTSASEPEETRKPNAEWQSPAFKGQTRAPKPGDTEQWMVETVTEGLDHPWAIEFLPDGSMLVTERPGNLRTVSSEGEVSGPIDGVPEVDARGQGGLLDVAVAPDFEESRRIFLSFAEPRGNGNGTAVATGVLDKSNERLTGLKVIFRQQPSWRSRGHFGSRIVFATDGTMYVTLGDRQTDESRFHAQDRSNHIGTVVRINRDGSIPDDNPFANGEDGAPEVWSYGHRNLQAADLHPETGELWTIEHGPRGGDELNQPEPGRNYGWPTITYGVEYSGSKVGKGITEKEGMEQPVYYWDPVIAPSGMDFYEGDRFPAWRGDLFVGGLASQQVTRLVMEDGRVTAEEWLSIGHRVRDVREGPDGAIYLITDEGNGKVLRIVPHHGD